MIEGVDLFFIHPEMAPIDAQAEFALPSNDLVREKQEENVQSLNG